VFTPVLAKHSKSFSLIDCISVGVDRMQRNFEPMRKQVESWQRSELTDLAAKVVIYEAFVKGRLETPKHLARTVHDLSGRTAALLHRLRQYPRNHHLASPFRDTYLAVETVMALADRIALKSSTHNLVAASHPFSAVDAICGSRLSYCIAICRERMFLLPVNR
jgi:hypothetical protein